MFATGVTMGLAEWIIADTWIIKIILSRNMYVILCVCFGVVVKACGICYF